MPPFEKISLWELPLNDYLYCTLKPDRGKALSGFEQSSGAVDYGDRNN